jgi:general stress protein 26
MADMTLSDLSKKMKDIDFVMLQTRTDNGEIAGRPMSNNKDVEYDGDSWFFLDDTSRVYSDVARDPKVNLAVQGAKGLLGKPGIFIAIEGEAELVKDKAAFEEHWTKDLERWWKDGVDSPGLALMKVHASRIHYWDGEDQGEVKVS